MFCDIAPFSFIIESMIFTGSSRFRPEVLLSCRALLVGPVSVGPLFVGPVSVGPLSVGPVLSEELVFSSVC